METLSEQIKRRRVQADNDEVSGLGMRLSARIKEVSQRIRKDRIKPFGSAGPTETLEKWAWEVEGLEKGCGDVRLGAPTQIHLDAGDPQTPREVLLFTTIARLKAEIVALERKVETAHEMMKRDGWLDDL